MTGRHRGRLSSLRTLMPQLLLIACLCSCVPVSTPPGPEAAYGQFEGAGYTYLRWEGGLRLLVWQGAVDESSCSSSASTGDPVFSMQCFGEIPGGRRVTWELKTRDGRTAQFSIENRDYELSMGQVFVILTEDGELEITQLPADLSSLAFDRESILRFTRGNHNLANLLNLSNPE